MEILPLSAFVAIMAASYAAFLAGRSASTFFHQSAELFVHDEVLSMPSPYLIEGKDVPLTKYTSALFDDSISKLYSLYLKSSHAEEEPTEVCVPLSDGSKQCLINNPSTSSQKVSVNANSSSTEKQEVHSPAGQHLLIDIKNVDGAFLNSEVRLANAMVNVVNESKLTLLSYHCHKLVPMGVSCVGVLLESHISFHTWPEEGVITLDLFTCGEGKLVPIMPIIERLFAIPQGPVYDGEEIEEPRVVWTHKLRGFSDAHKTSYLGVDLGKEVLEKSSFDMKQEIATAQTIFQRIDVYDTISATRYDILSYERSLSDDGSYEARHPELFRPQRIVFLDGILQSTRFGLEAYHESLVQPVMFAHTHPKRVAIIGGGEGATLKEVLKHETVEKVKMIEIDEEMVTVSRHYLPEWNDCSDIVGSADWCGDDSRAELHFEDALAWFNNRFSESKIDSEEYKEEPFDVLIMDALDPQDDVVFAEMLYTSRHFVEALYNSLSDDGVIVLQLGGAPRSKNPSDDMNKNKRRTTLINLLEDVGFESMHIYEEGHCQFLWPWTFLIAGKNKIMWHRSQSEVDIAIHKRILRTKSGTPALKYFDGAVQANQYSLPHRAFEVVYCRQEPIPKSCKTDNEKRHDIPTSNFDVWNSTIGDDSGRGVFTTVDIPPGSILGRKENVHPVVVRPSTVHTIWNYMGQSEGLSSFYDYVDGYGWEADVLGDDTYFVDSSIMTFMNHGCNGTFNNDDIAKLSHMNITESTATPQDMLPRRRVFDPVLDRMFTKPDVPVTTRAIKAGEELFCNYIYFSVLKDEWWTEVNALKRMCAGEVGFITQKEHEAIWEVASLSH